MLRQQYENNDHEGEDERPQEGTENEFVYFFQSGQSLPKSNQKQGHNFLLIINPPLSSSLTKAI